MADIRVQIRNGDTGEVLVDRPIGFAGMMKYTDSPQNKPCPECGEQRLVHIEADELEVCAHCGAVHEYGSD